MECPRHDLGCPTPWVLFRPQEKPLPWAAWPGEVLCGASQSFQAAGCQRWGPETLGGAVPAAAAPSHLHQGEHLDLFSEFLQVESELVGDSRVQAHIGVSPCEVLRTAPEDGAAGGDGGELHLLECGCG